MFLNGWESRIRKGIRASTASDSSMKYLDIAVVVVVVVVIVVGEEEQDGTVKIYCWHTRSGSPSTSL